ncbi:MAG: cyclic nucleotide-binding domain-containing protein [Gaiellaceae bacterium]
MSLPPLSEAARTVRHVLGNGGIRRIELAWVSGVAADWAFLVILLVVAYDAGGTLAVGLLGAVRMVPATLAAPFAPTLVERFRGDRALAAVNATRFVGALATALALAAGLPVAVTFVLAAVVAGAGALVRPIQLALLPALARSPRELVAANVTSSVGEGLGTFVGPLVAGVVVATSGSVAASVVAAAVFAGAAAVLVGVRFERAADAGGAPSVSWREGVARLAQAHRLVGRYRAASIVGGDFVAQVFVRGLMITLTVVAAVELLDLGESGVGALTAAFGLGGLVGSIGALGLGGGSPLVRVFAAALVGWGLPLALIGAFPAAALALAAFFVVGVSNALLDVSGFTLVQRGVRTEDRVTFLSVMEGAFGLALLLGSLAAALLVNVLGNRGALIAAGLILPALAALTARPLARDYRTTTGDEERLALLRSVPLFAPLPLTALERLCEGISPVAFDEGDVLMRQGDAGDRYLVLARGEVAVLDGTRALRTCGPGEGVGEIALLRRVPRTATVVATTPVAAYAIDSTTFLDAVAGPAARAAAEAAIASRIEP